MSPKRVDLEELAELCALRAGGVLAALLDRELVPQAPWIQILPGVDLESRLEGAERSAAVVAELEGAEVGRMALLVSDSAREAVDSMVEKQGAAGRSTSRAPESGQRARRDLMAASALLEMGNIAFSAAANALAEGVGGRVFPSVPRFTHEPAAELCEGRSADADVLLIQFELQGPSDSLWVRMAWLPDPAPADDD